MSSRRISVARPARSAASVLDSLLPRGAERDMGAGEAGDRPPIWVEGRQAPPFDVATFAQAGMLMTRDSALTALVRLSHQASGLSAQLACQDWSPLATRLGRVGPFLPQPARLAAMLQGVSQGALAARRVLCEPAPNPSIEALHPMVAGLLGARRRRGLAEPKVLPQRPQRRAEAAPPPRTPVPGDTPDPGAALEARLNAELGPGLGEIVLAISLNDPAAPAQPGAPREPDRASTAPGAAPLCAVKCPDPEGDRAMARLAEPADRAPLVADGTNPAATAPVLAVLAPADPALPDASAPDPAPPLVEAPPADPELLAIRAILEGPAGTADRVADSPAAARFDDPPSLAAPSTEGPAFAGLPVAAPPSRPPGRLRRRLPRPHWPSLTDRVRNLRVPKPLILAADWAMVRALAGTALIFALPFGFGRALYRHLDGTDLREVIAEFRP